MTSNIDGNISLPNIKQKKPSRESGELATLLIFLISQAHIELINYSIHSSTHFCLSLEFSKKQFGWDMISWWHEVEVDLN